MTTKKKSSRKRWSEIFERTLGVKGKIKMVELGVWHGIQAGRLLAMIPRLEWWGVDTWDPPLDGSSYLGSGAEIAEKNRDEFNAAYHLSVNAIRPFGERAHIIKADTVDAADQFEDYSLDVVFIDADHSYEGCRRDIIAWRSKVKPGGLLCGHDYANKNGDVKRAVDEQIGARVVLGADHTWFFRIPEDK
jgi:hypothetical protein